MLGLALPIDSGYQPFASDLEKMVSLGSSQVFDPLVSRMAGTEFASVDLLVNFCAKNLLVREAIMAFSAFTKAPSVVDPHKEALKSYQGCIIRLKKTRLDSQADPSQTCFILTAVCFLGLLEVSVPRPITPTVANNVKESWVWRSQQCPDAFRDVQGPSCSHACQIETRAGLELDKVVESRRRVHHLQRGYTFTFQRESRSIDAGLGHVIRSPLPRRRVRFFTVLGRAAVGISSDATRQCTASSNHERQIRPRRKNS